ncbi:MAG: hypothetical protein WA637_11730, partial [Terriglobales bacterium]
MVFPPDNRVFLRASRNNISRTSGHSAIFSKTAELSLCKTHRSISLRRNSVHPPGGEGKLAKD